MRWYLITTVQVRRYFTFAKSTTVPTKVRRYCSVSYIYGEKYDGTVVRRYKYDGTLLMKKITTVPKYDGTVVLQKGRKVRRYCGVAKMAKSTTVL